MENKKCKNCEKSLEGKDKRQKFCSHSCSTTFNNKGRVHSKKTKERISIAVSKATKGKYRKIIKSILELSGRTVRKILKRLNLGCSNCGWDKGTCDIHHINGRKINDYDNHNNLSLLCPNCHRMVHEGTLDKNILKNLNETIPNNWKDYYYG